MVEWLLAESATVRLALFLTVLLGLMGLETVWPRRNDIAASRRSRWPGNLFLPILATAVLRLFSVLSPLAAAQWATTTETGLFPAIGVSPALAVPLGIVVMDAAIWAQHWLFHQVPLLWRLHRLHHTDPGFDVTTATRFHPLEIILSAALKAALAILLGLPVLGMVLFECLLSTAALFSHANIALPRGLDRGLRFVIVTPDMHRCHHSTLPEETNSNYGFFLSVWDRLFGTWTEQPRAGHPTMLLGLDTFRDPADQTPGQLLLQPWRR